MLPFCFEWHWDIGHLVFFGLFYAALAVMGASLLVAFLYTMKALLSPSDNSAH